MDSAKKRRIGAAFSGLAAGTVNGLFGGGGGMLLIPGLKAFSGLEEDQLFPVSVSVMGAVSILTLFLSAGQTPLPWGEAFPYLVGSAIGGVLVGFLGKKIPALWLHRLLGVMLLWGGARYLW